MRTLFSTRHDTRQTELRRRASRRDFLRLERLENRYALAGASPAAVNDLYETLVDQPLEITVETGILSNDTDAEGDDLAAGVFSEPAHGTLELNEDGSFHYTPEEGFVGIDSFMYFTSDGSGDSLLAAVTIRVEEPDSAPVAANDSYAAEEDSPLLVGAAEGLLGNDTDADSDTLTPTIASQPQHGTLVVNGDGSFSYTPEANYNGLDGFSYFVNDGEQDSAVASVTINVASVNDAPTAANDELTTAEDTPLEVVAPGVLANDADVDGDALSTILVAPPQHGTVTLNPDGSLLYTPDADFNGTDGFSYQAGDGSTESDVASVTITVTPVSDAPIGTADSFTLAEDAVLTIDAAAGVLANDTDADGDALTAALVSGPTSGTLTLNPDGSFSYTPNSNFSGADSFTYTASDGGLTSSEITVSLEVTPVNDAPTAANDEFTTAEDTPLTVPAPGVIGNDTDPESDPLTVSILSPPANGTVTLNADGSFTYTPNSNFSGMDGFSYLASDGSASSEAASVTINVTPVNDGPAAEGESYTTDEDTPLAVDIAGGVLANDSDPEGDSLTAAIVTAPTNGTLTLNPDGSFNYVPNSGVSGSDSFTYTVSDGTLTAEATATITVNPVNDVPVATDDALNVNEDETLTLTAPGILANDTDADGEALTAALVTGPANGTLTLNPDGSLSYAPNSNFSGSDSFTYTVSDGTATSNTATVTIAVAAVNDGPTAAGESYTAEEDTSLVVDAATGVLANDSDPEGDALTAAVVTGPTNGTLTLNPDGSFTYAPNANFSGSDAFTYTVSDGTITAEATATITVSPGNDAPIAVDDELSVNEDEVLTVDAPGILANDSDPDGDAISPNVVTGPANGTLELHHDGGLIYTPNAGFSGTDSFTYSVEDDELTGSTATVTIIVCSVNDSPAAEGDAYSVDEDAVLTVDAPGVLANDTDVEGDALTAAIVTGPASGTVTMNADGSFVYTPNSNFSGTDTFVYAAGDGTETAEATVTITVNPLADAPTAGIDSYSAGEDIPLTVSAAMGVLANDLDPAGGGLTASVVDGPTHGTLTLNPDGSFTYTPPANWNGSDSFTYKAVTSGGEEIVSQANIVVEPLNDAPTAGDDEYTIGDDGVITDPADEGGEGVAEAEVPGGVLANDGDIDSSSLTAMLVEGPAHGTLVLNADGTFTYVPEEGYSGDDSFRYQVFDGMANSNVATVMLHIDEPSEAPLPPTAADDAYTMAVDEVLEIAGPGVLENDTDPEGDALSAAVVDGPLHGTVALDSTGGFVYTPEAGYTGSDSFTYEASDGTGVSNLATVSITIEAANENQRPEAINDSFTMTEGTTLEVTADLGLLLNDSDPEGAPLLASLFSGPLGGSLTLNDDGSFTYTPNEGFTGIDSFLYRVSDGELLSALGAVTIHVNPAEDPEPAPIPEPEPEPSTCLAMDDSLLDQIMAEGADPHATDAALDDEWMLA